MQHASYDLASAIQQAVQVTVATKVSAFLTLYIAGPTERALLVVSATVLIVYFQGHLAKSWTTTASITADLALAVTSAIALDTLVVRGAANAPLALAHMCVFLIAGEVLARRVLGGLASAFLSNAQYLFANIVTTQLLALGIPLLAFVAAAAMSVLSSWECWTDSLLAQSFALAGVGVFKAMLLDSIPDVLQLPTVVALVCFARPLQTKGLAYAQTLYNFALYQAAGSLQEVLERLLPLSTALLLAMALAFLAPTEAYAAICQVAAVGVATDFVLSSILQAANSDPFLALVCVMLAVRVLLKAVEG